MIKKYRNCKLRSVEEMLDSNLEILISLRILSLVGKKYEMDRTIIFLYILFVREERYSPIDPIEIQLDDENLFFLFNFLHTNEIIYSPRVCFHFFPENTFFWKNLLEKSEPLFLIVSC